MSYRKISQAARQNWIAYLFTRSENINCLVCAHRVLAPEAAVNQDELLRVQ